MFCSRCGTEVQPTSKFCPTCGLDLTTVTQGGGAGTAAQPAAPQDDATAVREALKDEYELEKELGRGGMAIVFKARDKSLEREVAIKVLPFSLSFDAEFVERFQREARTSAKLEHPNIIPIYRVGKSGRVIFFVMKFLRGKPLSDVIEARGAIPVPEIKRVLIEAARALGYAHKHGIVHRDIKPDNIMFDELGQAIVTDFGIAKAQSGARLTGTGMSIGTPHYMSPEQARAQNLDGRSDIYSLGVVGYQCLTGHVPFDGEDSFSIGYKHIMEELPTPALETAEQRELFAIIQKMMAKKVEDRFQTAEDLVAALEGTGGVASAMMSDVATRPTAAIGVKDSMAAIAAQATTPLPRASGSMAPPPGYTPGGPAAPPAPAKPERKPRPVPKKKSRAPLLVGVVLVLAGAGLGGYLAFPEQIRQVLGMAPSADSLAHVRQLAVAESLATRHRADSLAKSAADSARAESTARARTASRGKPPGRREEVAVAPQSTKQNCDAPTTSIQNPHSDCYDSPANARNAPLIRPPATCTVDPGATTLLVHVSATGEVMQQPTVTGRSKCAGFDQMAVSYMADMPFDPARKRSAGVASWKYVLVRPLH
ncbi:MAG: serine/threonine-protein kinase [Gemmatimonadales bacterium]|jgi:predicted Ser/Thr protein kinase